MSTVDCSLRPEAVAAAKWWGALLRDNADPTGSNDTPALLNRLLPRTYAPEEQIATFEAVLSHAISQRMTEEPSFIIEVRWEPDPILVDAATQAGILKDHKSIYLFPWHSLMWIQGGHVLFRTDHCIGPVELTSI